MQRDEEGDIKVHKHAVSQLRFHHEPKDSEGRLKWTEISNKHGIKPSHRDMFQKMS